MGRWRALWLRLAPAGFVHWAQPTTAELGAAGEELAARYLRRSGWELLGRRVAVDACELDLVARCGTELVCVEVKTGYAPSLGTPPPAWRPLDRLGHAQLQRQARGARQVARRMGNARPARLDLIEIRIERRRAICITHLRALDAAAIGVRSPPDGSAWNDGRTDAVSH